MILMAFVDSLTLTLTVTERTWEESMQKALRMTDPSGTDGFQPHGRIR